MKFVPRNTQLIGRMTIRKSESKIIRGDETKVTKYLLVDAVGPEAASKGIKVGDIVLVVSIKHIVQDAGMVFIPFAEEKDVVLFATDISLDELLVQTPSGKNSSRSIPSKRRRRSVRRRERRTAPGTRRSPGHRYDSPRALRVSASELSHASGHSCTRA